ncbi:MAG: hypothetical protein JWP61_611, partial [Friedmanniella sp.]|nr:hypothetical protein [Friedmanniella sp.]
MTEPYGTATMPGPTPYAGRTGSAGEDWRQDSAATWRTGPQPPAVPPELLPPRHGSPGERLSAWRR